MENNLNEIYKYADDHSDKYVEELRSLLRTTPVSLVDEVKYKSENLIECAEMIKKQMDSLGAETEILQGPPWIFPIVYGKLKSKKPGAKTLLVYGKYDVMPADEPDWVAPPFEGRIMDARNVHVKDPAIPEWVGKIIVARGVNDGAGPCFAFLKALESIKNVTNNIPVNLFLAWEGDEELLSPHMRDFIVSKKEELKAADGLVSVNIGGQGGLDKYGKDPKTAFLRLGGKGMLLAELRVSGGDWGGPAQRALETDDVWVDAPAWRLVWALNSLKGPEGFRNIRIGGFYDAVRPLTSVENDLFVKLRDTIFDEEQWKKGIGIKKFRRGLSGKDLFVSWLTEPEVNICGFQSGYVGPKIKTNLPQTAWVKLSIRLQPNQTPDDILYKLRRHLNTHGFPEVEIDVLATMLPIRAPATSDVVKAAQRAAEKHGFKPMLWPNTWGSMPMREMSQPLGLEERYVGCGLGLGGHNHQVNEFWQIEGNRNAVKYYITFLHEYSRIPSAKPKQ